jgi:hypothetical protein
VAVNQELPSEPTAAVNQELPSEPTAAINQELPSEPTAAINQELPSEPTARTRPDTEAVERSSRPDLVVEQWGSNREPNLTVEKGEPEETTNGRPTAISPGFFDPAIL